MLVPGPGRGGCDHSGGCPHQWPVVFNLKSRRRKKRERVVRVLVSPVVPYRPIALLVGDGSSSPESFLALCLGFEDEYADALIRHGLRVEIHHH